MMNDVQPEFMKLFQAKNNNIFSTGVLVLMNSKKSVKEVS